MERTYQRTHIWIKFHIDLKDAQAQMWLALGEAASKCNHLCNVPLRPDTATQLHQVYLAKGALASAAIEGNTLSEDDALKAVRGTLKVPPSEEYLKQEIQNIIGACNLISESVRLGTLPPLSLELVKSYNKQVLTGLTLEDHVTPGQLRTCGMVVGNVYKAPPPEDCPHLLDRLFEWLNSDEFKPKEKEKDYDFVYAIIKATVAHIYLAWIHGFGDGNGRTARLVEFHILLASGIPSPAAHLLSNHYNHTRAEYYRQLDYASKSGGDILQFITYAVRGLVDGLKKQLDFVWGLIWHVTWENYVHSTFQSFSGDANSRRRNLALDLGKSGAWIDTNSVKQLTPRLAEAYASKTTKTIRRDVNFLKKRGIIERQGQRIRAKREIILQFLPLRRHDQGAKSEAELALLALQNNPAASILPLPPAQSPVVAPSSEQRPLPGLL